MTKMTKYRITLFFFPALALWVSCTQQRQPCLTPKTASLIIETMRKDADTGTKFSDTALQSAVFTPLTADPANQTHFIYTLRSSFAVSLSPDTVVCQWSFSSDSARFRLNVADTLTFYYARQLQFLSNACGYAYFYVLDSVHTTHLMIDSLHITNTSVTNNVNTKHLQVFIHRGF